MRRDPMKRRDVHFCATCMHIQPHRQPDGRVTFRCARLGYETSPKWRFDCWQAREAYRDDREDDQH